MDDDALGELLDELDIGLELNSAGPAIEPLLEALIRGTPHGSLQQTADAAVDALWDTALEGEVRAELEAFRVHSVEQNMRLVPTIDAAIAELRAPARQNHVAHALVWRAASTLMRRATRNQDRMAELERTLEHTPHRQRRRVTLPIAAAATLAADIGDEEAAKAVAAYAFAGAAGRRPSRKQHERATARLVRSLATDERRRDIRAALAELAELSAADFPLASRLYASCSPSLSPMTPRRTSSGSTSWSGLLMSSLRTPSARRSPAEAELVRSTSVGRNARASRPPPSRRYSERQSENRRARPRGHQARDARSLSVFQRIPALSSIAISAGRRR